MMMMMIVTIGQNTMKTPRDLGRLAVSLTSVKDIQLVEKKLQGM